MQAQITHTMQKKTYLLRTATQADAPFIALIMAEAVGNPVMERQRLQTLDDEDNSLLTRLTAIAEADDTLYSWKKTLIATTPEGTPVAGLIAYPGEGYLECRRRTFAMVGDSLPFDPETMDLETRDGEYYLDSLAVLPEHRGQGLARLLLSQGIQRAHALGRPAILACAPDNVGAKSLYESLGFAERGHMFIFGEDYLRMENPTSSV